MTSISNGEDGLSVRTKLNNVLNLYDRDGFANVAALLADTSLTYSTVTAGDIVRTRSEGFAYQVAASGATDHHIVTAGGVKLYVLTPNVLAFGAIGNGSTDDTTAIIAAANAFATSGAVLEFPQGTYVLGNSSWPTSVNIRGAGIGRSTILWKASSAEANLIALSGAVNFIARDLTFNSNRQNQTDSTGFYGAIGGSLSNGARVILDRCEFLNGRILDIGLTGPTGSNQYAEVNIANCRFTDGFVGTSTRAAQAVSVSEGIRLRATGNEFKQPAGPSSYGRGGIVMQRPAGSTSLSWGQFETTGNSFENFGLQTSDVLGCLYVYSGSEATTIANNRFKNSYGTAITVKSDCGPTSVTGNVIEGHFSTNTAAIAFFDQADTYTSSIGRGLVVTGNSVYDAEFTSIFVDGARSGLSDFKNAIVADNICDGGVRGILFRNIDTLMVRGNVVNNTSGIAIFGGDCAGDITLSGNIITSGVVGIDLDGTTSSARLNVSGNQISTLTGSAIRLRTSVESFHIQSNTISGCTDAFDTRGASQFSSIADNRVRGESVAWAKSGSYNGLQYLNNVTSVAFGFSSRQLTIASDAVTVFADWHWVDTEGAASSDDLSTINGGYEGRRVVLFAGNSGRDVVLKDGTGNLRLSSDFTLTHADDSIELMFRNSVWIEIGRSDNTA